MPLKVEVHVKSLPYAPRGKAGEYRAGSVQRLSVEEAQELEAAGIVMIVGEPYEADESDIGAGEVPVDPPVEEDEQGEQGEEDLEEDLKKVAPHEDEHDSEDE